MTGVDRLRAHLPELLAGVASKDVRTFEIFRHAISQLEHYDLPLGLKHEDALIGLMPRKLESVNFWMADWRRRNQLRKTWATQLWKVVCSAEKVASREGLRHLGRLPDCQVPMLAQIFRLVPSVREFIRDDDDLFGSAKQLYDAMKDVGLIREDRREWLTMQMPVQDVSSITTHSFHRGEPVRIPVAVTVFILRPATPGLFATGAPPDVHRSVHPSAHSESRAQDRGAQEGRAVSRVRRRAGPRAVDV